MISIPKSFSYPARCACGHSEYIYGWTHAELEYQKNVRIRFFCTACSISPTTEAICEEAKKMEWLDYEGKRLWVLRKVRESALAQKEN
jgi:hypothetical protein